MPNGLSDARNLLDGKLSIPSELRTAEWSLLPQWLRERSFYMAGVSEVEILQKFRDHAAKIAQGEASVEESRKQIEQFLTGIGYAPKPGQEGTIKDLTSMRRIQTSLRTNVDLLQGWGQKERGRKPGAMAAFPAWELIRVMPRLHSRNWSGNHATRKDPRARWIVAGGKFTEDGRMIAMKDSPVWLELGSFADGLGVDYPPFAWGSGMGWTSIGFREAKALGVIPAGWTPPASKPVSSPNETLQCTPQVTERTLRDELARRMKGLAEWKGEKLLFTDPNGTRPMAGEKLAEIWQRGMPTTFEDFPDAGMPQKEAFLQWVADHAFFWNEGSESTRLGGKNIWDDLLRFFSRILPTGREKQPLLRALTWNNNEKFSAFMEGIRHDGYAARPEVPAESWTASAQAARKYLGGARYTVLLRLPSGHSAGRDIAPLVRAFQSELLRREVPQGKLALTDDEIILPSWAGLRVKRIGKITDTSNGKSVEIELEEAP